ncbi:hypothetical protein H312_03456 [Anncaliia algerae PRA339]|uniref:Uncharacterized protein n=1 Tax=Anncaliia algerae PRA339 TaxID=1288291 RepID=A0A059EW77_9MICR|nr:hypothetical protein H312_03456 [Anncaliia algerae PRA339]
MEYENKKYFIIKGSIEGKYITGTNKSYLITNEHGYILKRTLPSSTFLIINDNKITKCDFILETINYAKNEIHIFNNLSFCMNSFEFQIKHNLGDKELNEFINKFKLIKFKDNLYKLSYAEMFKGVIFYHSLIYTESTLGNELEIFQEVLREYLMNMIEGSVEDVCIFFLLKCWEGNDLKNVINRIEDYIFMKISKERLINIIENEELYCLAKDSILKHLYSNY